MLPMYFIEETSKAQEYQFPKATQPVTVIELEFKLVSDIPQNFALHCIAFLHNLLETCYCTLLLFSIVPCTSGVHSNYMLTLFVHRIKLSII